jgi:hypothetical protein
VIIRVPCLTSYSCGHARMMGGPDFNFDSWRAFFKERGVVPSHPRMSRAFDLGCG